MCLIKISPTKRQGRGRHIQREKETNTRLRNSMPLKLQHSRHHCLQEKKEKGQERIRETRKRRHSSNINNGREMREGSVRIPY